ncbi:hypothetical protein GJAV_G00272610 [Gymnothorax javanicus]|nr:hypothetical protein GJAV_G00272610 [Gymnothorax javanicus]
MNEAKDNQSQAPKPGCENDGNQMDIELPEQPVKEKETSPMETYCCLARWLCVMSGYRERSVCSCQKKEESNLEKMKPSASINTTDMLPATRPVAEDPSDNMGNARSVHNTGGSTQPGGDVRGVNDVSVLPQHQTVRHPEQSSMHASKVTNWGIHSEAETRLKTPSDHSGRGKQASPESCPKAVSNGSKVLEVETKHVNSSCSEVRKMTSKKSVPLGRRRSSKDLPRTKIEGRDIGCKLRGTESTSIGLRAESLSRNKFILADRKIYQTSVNFTSKNASKRVTIEERQRSLTAGPLVKLNKLVLEKRKRLQAAHRPYTRHEAQIKSKYELGNPAVVPLQKDGMLQFKLLPESFNFKDSRDDRESVKPKDLTKTKVAVGGQREENLKTKTWKLEGSWSKSSKSRGLTRPEGKTPAGTAQSDTVFQEYKRKHMAKGKK